MPNCAYQSARGASASFREGKRDMEEQEETVEQGGSKDTPEHGWRKETPEQGVGKETPN